MCFSDIMTDFSVYQGMLKSYQVNPCDALLALNWVEDPSAGAAVYEEANRIIRLVEKPAPGTSTTHWNQAGIFVFGPEMLNALNRVTPSARGEYEITSATQILLSENRSVRAYPISKEMLWSDVGTLEELERLNNLAGSR
jgi:dTDP-glucose pyrophosphorylase